MPRKRGGSRDSALAAMPTAKNSTPDINFLTSHLWTSLLEKTTTDVSIRVTGSWRAIYFLHKVVIIQSGFFRTLFTAGFSEAAGSKRDQDRALDIVFDDTNITRSAFEFCIARLYGGGPSIHIPESLVPTTSQPLTSCYPWSLEPDPPYIQEPIPTGHQAGTPAFLMSLLATSVYLSIPAITTQALSTILSTIGPHTVLQYLDFACGKPITQVEGHEDLDNAAVGLEGVAEMFRADSTRASPAVSIRTSRTVRKRDLPENDLEALYLEGVKSEGLRFDSASMAGSDSESDAGSDHTPSYHYGAVSDKIGESCVCWLARWGADILTWEENYWDAQITTPSAFQDLSASNSFPPSRPRTIPTRVDSSSPSHSKESGTLVKFPYRPTGVPMIWSPEGLSPHWIKALVSADTLFVRDEKERFELAKRVVELRRRLDGVSERYEKVWRDMFDHGIFYANLSMEDILAISHDLSPTTGRTYVSLSTLQAAHWDQSLLKHQVMAGRSGSPTASPASFLSHPHPKDAGNRLGNSQTSSEIHSAKNQAVQSHYYAIPGNTALRFGDSGLNNASTEDQLMTPPGAASPSTATSTPFILSPSPSGFGGPSAGPTSARGSTSMLKTTESNFFGLTTSKQSSSKLSCSSSFPPGQPGQQQWSPYPPFRFSVEFFDIASLKEKSRLHSQTFWYAGSLFNVYTQILRKKSGGTGDQIQTKMGIYLQRQSSVEELPRASAPSLISERVERERVKPRSESGSLDEGMTKVMSGTQKKPRAHFRGPSLPNIHTVTGSTPPSPSHFSPSIHPASRSRPTTPNSALGGGADTPSLPSSSSHPNSYFPSTVSNTLPATAPVSAPSQPYRDPRGKVSAYFAISCASATGTSQTRFTSSPDEFGISKSWGWPSSSLRTEEYVDQGSGTKETGKEVSFRATVVLGLV